MSANPPVSWPEYIVFLNGGIKLYVNQWRHLADGVTIGIFTALLLGFVVVATRHRLWHTNRYLKLFLSIVSNPLYYFLGQSALLVLRLPYINELYVVWAVLLFLAFGSLFTILGCSWNMKRGMEHEKFQLYNNMSVFWLLFWVPIESEFFTLLFVLWGLSMLKLFQRFISFRAAQKEYGARNTELVSLHMEAEHEVNSDFDASTMKGYKYLVLGEDHAEANPPAYVATIPVTNHKIVVVNDVWQCKGRLLRRDGGDPKGLLKDMCLSFALFKLIKRRFEFYPQSEADQLKTRKFVLVGLLSGEEEEVRAFRVIDMELAFLRDLFYTRQPITFGFLVQTINILHFAVIGITLWVALLKAHKYKIPTYDEDSKIDPKLTLVIVALVTLLEVWEFSNYMFSDWAKVILLCKYVKHHDILDRIYLDKIIHIICWRKLPRRLNHRIPQYSLLHNVATGKHAKLCCCLTCGLSGKEIKKGRKKDAPVKLTPDVKKAICSSLKNLLGGEAVEFSNGTSTLLRHNVSGEMKWACSVGIRPRSETHVHTVLIWHIATSFCDLKESSQNTSDKPNSSQEVATCLSKYCAYLLVFAPEFLPINAYFSGMMIEKILDEARGVYKKMKGKRMYEVLCSLHDNSDQTIIAKGARLGKQLMEVEDSKRWKILEEFWAELILFLAPSKNFIAHERKLGDGGEFITQLWALLYHAGISRHPFHNDMQTIMSA